MRICLLVSLSPLSPPPPVPTHIHTSDLALLPAPAMLTGIVLSSVLMQRNSPDTHIVVTHTREMTHQVADRGSEPLYQVQHTRCRRCTVAVKSRHSLVL